MHLLLSNCCHGNRNVISILNLDTFIDLRLKFCEVPMRCSQVTQVFMQNKAVFVLKNARKGSKFRIGCLVCSLIYTISNFSANHFEEKIS